MCPHLLWFISKLCHESEEHAPAMTNHCKVLMHNNVPRTAYEAVYNK
jgi:hypothetical protein